MWDVEGTDEFSRWFLELPDDEAKAVTTVIDRLQVKGPTMGRPHADRIKTSRHHHMKELRARHGREVLRVLFAFDPNRMALLLIGGSKTDNWQGWYDQAIPAADDLYDTHLATLDDTQEDT